MPLPRTANLLHGGCNCGAIRYILEIPDYSDRPFHPSVEPCRMKLPTAERLPYTCTDSSNEYRQATAGLFTAIICMPARMVHVSCIKRISPQVKRSERASFKGRSFSPFSFARFREAIGPLSNRMTEVERPPYRPGMEMLLPSDASEDTFLGFYHAAPRWTRSFCGRCGTPIAFNKWATDKGYPEDVLDIVMGTLDEGCLEGVGAPEMHFWYDEALSWVKAISKAWRGLKHPFGRVDQIVYWRDSGSAI